MRSHNDNVDLHGRSQPCIHVATVFHFIILLCRFKIHVLIIVQLIYMMPGSPESIKLLSGAASTCMPLL